MSNDMPHYDTSSPISVFISIVTFTVLQHPLFAFVPQGGGYLDTIIDSLIKGVFAVFTALIANEAIKKRNKKD